MCVWPSSPPRITAVDRHRYLPKLLEAFNYGGAGSAVLAPLFKIGKMLSKEEYTKQIVPCVVKLFASTDRKIRINLLQQLHLFVEYLSEDVVNTQIYPNIATGFSDTIPAMREQTVRSMLLLAPKLSATIKEGPLLQHFAKYVRADCVFSWLSLLHTDVLLALAHTHARALLCGVYLHTLLLHTVVWAQELTYCLRHSGRLALLYRIVWRFPH